MSLFFGEGSPAQCQPEPSALLRLGEVFQVTPRMLTVSRHPSFGDQSLVLSIVYRPISELCVAIVLVLHQSSKGQSPEAMGVLGFQ